MQAANSKQAARHTKEVEELLLELSKQHAAAQAVLPSTHQGLSGSALAQEEEQQGPSRSLTPLPPRLPTPASPSRRPKTHSRGFHTPPGDPPEMGDTVLRADSARTEQAQDESLRAEQGRSFSSSYRWGEEHTHACNQ